MELLSFHDTQTKLCAEPLMWNEGKYKKEWFSMYCVATKYHIKGFDLGQFIFVSGENGNEL